MGQLSGGLEASVPSKEGLAAANVFGMAIAQLDLQGLLDYFASALGSSDDHPRGAHLIAYANAHTCNLFLRDAACRQAMQAVDVIYVDGNGPRLAAWLSGQWLPRRMTSADWYPDLFERCQQRGWSLYLLGAAPGVSTQAAQRLQAEYPALEIRGAHHGYFAPDEEEAILKEIRRLRPHLLVLGMGSPRQEIWMAQHRADLPVRVIWATGGLIDHVAGVTPRAPGWMRWLGLEWLWRAMIEPRRLAGRYLIGTPFFLLHSIRFALQRRLGGLLR